MPIVLAQETGLLQPLLPVLGDGGRRVPTSPSLRPFWRLRADRADAGLRLLPGFGHVIGMVLLLRPEPEHGKTLPTEPVKNS